MKVKTSTYDILIGIISLVSSSISIKINHDIGITLIGMGLAFIIYGIFESVQENKMNIKTYCPCEIGQMSKEKRIKIARMLQQAWK